jgi:hypothetical protein
MQWDDGRTVREAAKAIREADSGAGRRDLGRELFGMCTVHHIYRPVPVGYAQGMYI